MHNLHAIGDLVGGAKTEGGYIFWIDSLLFTMAIQATYHNHLYHFFKLRITHSTKLYHLHIVFLLILII